MGFSTPDMPEMPKSPPMPLDPTIIERRRRMRKERKAGRLSSILTSPRGLLSRGSTIAAPTLLGGSSGAGGVT